MNLKSVSDENLLRDTDALVRQERELLTRVLHHLREIERRRLFSSLGFTSLFDYCVRRLSYSEDQAARRISAMRLMKELPEIEEKLSSGSLSLTHVGMAQSMFKKEEKATQKKFSTEEKLAVLQRLEDTTTREAEKALLRISTVEPVTSKDSVKMISEFKVVFKFVADIELQRKIKTIRGLLAHSNPNISLEGLFNKICDIGIRELSPAAPRVTPRKSQPNSLAQIRRDVWMRDGHQCTKCGSTYALELDHMKPRANGGSDSRENLRVLCRSCNQRAAIEHYGVGKMENFLRERPVQYEKTKAATRAA